VAFQQDLLQQLQIYCQEGIAFILVEDFNEAYGSDPDGISSSIAGSLGITHLMLSQSSKSYVNLVE
jgi:hypothetical protein